MPASVLLWPVGCIRKSSPSRSAADPAPVLRVLCPALGSSGQESPGAPGAGASSNDQGPGAPLFQGKAERAGAVQL